MEDSDCFAFGKTPEILQQSEMKTVCSVSWAQKPSTSLYTLFLFICADTVYELGRLWLWQHPWPTPFPFPCCWLSNRGCLRLERLQCCIDMPASVSAGSFWGLLQGPGTFAIF